MRLEKEMIENYFESISKLHKNKENISGFEKHDRSIFIRDFLVPLGYSLENILDDVSQKVETGSRTPDIRLFGNNEVKNKQTHSQFVIETKNFNHLQRSIENIDFLQLKRYIKANQSKIRLICSTDYLSLFIFNATQIKKDTRVNFDNLDNISKYEIEIFANNLYHKVEFDRLSPKDMKCINTIRYNAIFENQTFINPEEYEKTNSIAEYSVRQNFISTLYRLMLEFENDIKHDFFDKIEKVCDALNTSQESFFTALREQLNDSENMVVRNYFLWGSEMNYIKDFMTNPSCKIEVDDVNDYMRNSDHKEAFVLTSIYNLINKTFFLRILEDIATQNTKFIEGAYNFRYLSNGILNEKYKISEEELIEYLKNIYEFQKADLKKYSFLLKKDIYSWVLEFVSPHYLLSLIRLFNDINFKKLSQDILGDIYEHYLEQGGNEEQEKTYRRLLGQYYTAKPVVRFMWMLVRDVLNESHHRDLYENDKENINILDPACGSGTFLSEAVLQINSIASKKTINPDGRVFSFIKDRNETKKIENYIYGFELNPLSKSIADINMFFSLIQAYGDNLNSFPIKALKLFRTNSYDMQTYFESTTDKENQNLFLLSEVVRSSVSGHDALINAKNNKYDIIIGNPPYGYIKPTRFMKEKLIPYAYAENNFDTDGIEVPFTWDNALFNGVVPEHEKNKGKLTDMYAFFFGIADLLVKSNGIICFITSNTYLTIPTYKWLRKYWLENYSIHYIVNFNDISEKSNSMFAPEAGIATCIIIMTKKTARDHKIKYLDLSNINNIPDKYNAFCDIRWNDRKKNKNDIQKFLIKPLAEINFKEVLQEKYLKMNDYIFSYSDYDSLLDIIEKQSNPLSTYANLNTGVDVGDLNFLVDSTQEGIKSKITNYVFAGELSYFNNTSKEYISGNIEKGKITGVFDEKRVIPFVYQKHMTRFGYSEKYYTYLDNNILWRSRLHNTENVFDNPIMNSIKLGVLEKRSSGEIYAFVTDEIMLPQHGGRFAYLVSNSSLSINDMYLLSGLINSQVVHLYYKYRQLGVKDVLVKKIGDIPNELSEQLIKTAKDIHLCVKDKMSFNNDHHSYESQWFKDEVLPYIKTYTLIEDSNYWEIDSKGVIFPDYSISKAKIEEKDDSIIILNSDLRIKFKDADIANQVYRQYLEKYEGHLEDNPIIINIMKMLDPKEYNAIIIKINSYFDSLNEQLNSIVYKIYGLNEEEVEILNNLLTEER